MLSHRFVAVFIAELGGKTQPATLLFAAASLALLLLTLLGVLLDSSLGTLPDERWLHRLAGIGFVVIGLWGQYTT